MRARRGWCLSLFSKFSSPGARGLRCAFRSFPEKAARRLLKRVTGSFALFRAETSALRVAAPLRARLPPQQRRAQRLAAPGSGGAGGTGHGAVPKPPESRGNQPRTSPRGPASPRFNGGSEARPRGGGGGAPTPYLLPPSRGRPQRGGQTPPAPPSPVSQTFGRGTAAAAAPGDGDAQRTGEAGTGSARQGQGQQLGPASHRVPPPRPPRGAAHWPAPTVSAPLIRGGPCPSRHCRGPGLIAGQGRAAPQVGCGAKRSGAGGLARCRAAARSRPAGASRLCSRPRGSSPRAVVTPRPPLSAWLAPARAAPAAGRARWGKTGLLLPGGGTAAAASGPASPPPARGRGSDEPRIVSPVGSARRAAGRPAMGSAPLSPE